MAGKTRLSGVAAVAAGALVGAACVGWWGELAGNRGRPDTAFDRALSWVGLARYYPGERHRTIIENAGLGGVFGRD